MDNFAQGTRRGRLQGHQEVGRAAQTGEIRNANARSYRRDVFMRTRTITIQEAAAEVMEEAYLKASAQGTLPVQPRQIMYAARGHIQERTGRKLDDRYFTQTMLPNYVEENGVDWDIVWNARGSFHEPHTNRHVPLGTLEVRAYLGSQKSHYLPPDQAGGWKTTGPRTAMVASCSWKGGFFALFRKVQLAERYDIAIMSTKGVSTTAARTLIDGLIGAEVPVFCIRDFDVSGFNIAGTLAAIPDAIMGEQWRDRSRAQAQGIQRYTLESEDVFYLGANGRHLDGDESFA